ncbi:hypothetical protein GGX14DRAFT_604681 [Mycena pura]|uniref:AAA+ ATPase domain-containing protein n=1 Tax=Mycena pura TaxID=153505 RepID=A0AAD6YE68_9AGAR|nr:hypothetical protein GGX14DRAFT_604681 [Mycena pura]
MPPKPTTTLQPLSTTDSILQNAIVASDALRKISDSSSGSVPFLQSISAVSFAIFSVVQAVKVNKEQYVRMVEQIQTLLWAIAEICYKSKIGAVLPLSIVNNIGNFARTLQKILTCAEDQLKMGKVKRFFRQAEHAQQLEACKTELEHSLQVISVQHGIGTLATLADLKIEETARREQLLELASSFAATATASSETYSLYGGDSVASSSSSLSMLPPSPKIFHGRESELKALVSMFLQPSARGVILGPGGIGKTSLATAVMHDPDIVAKYTQRYFVPCDSALTPAALLSLVASHLRLNQPESRVTPKLVIRHLSAAGPAVLLVFDNFETAWEPPASREKIEDLLSLLTNIAHLALLASPSGSHVTMRGAERPSKVRWTRPFLVPLTPLTYEAARKTFFDIADEDHDNVSIQKLLRLTDNVPLAVNLIANLASFEGSETVLLRWKDESTTLLSEGQDRRSNLDMSIMLSLSSPRIQSVPGAQELLGVLSLLPDGLTAADLAEISFPTSIPETQKCRAALIRTSVTYRDQEERLKVLVPIREYVLKYHRPAMSLVRPVRAYLNDVLMLWKSYRQISAPDCIPRVTAHLGNFNSVLDWGLRYDDDDVSGTIKSILNLDSFARATNREVTNLLDRVHDFVERCGDPRLTGDYTTMLFEKHLHRGIPDFHKLEIKGIESFKLANDPVGEVQLYNVLGSYYLMRVRDNDKALGYYRRALQLATKIRDANGETKAWMHLAEVDSNRGNYRLSVKYAQRAQQATKPNGHLIAEAHCIEVEARSLTALGDFKRAAEQLTRARMLAGLCRMRWGSLDISLMNAQGDIHFFKSEYEEVRTVQVQILEKTSEHNPIEYALAHLNIARVNSAVGADEPIVRKNLDTARTTFTQVEFPLGIDLCDIAEADLQLRLGRTAEPCQCYRRCLSSYLAEPEFAILCLNKLADPAFCLHDLPTTFGYALALLGVGRKSQNMLAIHTSLRCLGDIFSVQGDEDTAVSLFTLALEGFMAMDVHRSRADCLVRLGESALRRGNVAKAEAAWTEAWPLYERSSQGKTLGIVDEKLASLRTSY